MRKEKIAFDFLKLHTITKTNVDTVYSKEKKVHKLFENNYKIIFTQELIENIDVQCRIDTKFKFTNLENASILAMYYKIRNCEEKGLKYANFVKEHGKVLTKTYNLICDYYGKDEREEIK